MPKLNRQPLVYNTDNSLIPSHSYSLISTQSLPDLASLPFLSELALYGISRRLVPEGAVLVAGASKLRDLVVRAGASWDGAGPKYARLDERRRLAEVLAAVGGEGQPVAVNYCAHWSMRAVYWYCVLMQTKLTSLLEEVPFGRSWWLQQSCLRCLRRRGGVLGITFWWLCVEWADWCFFGVGISVTNVLYVRGLNRYQLMERIMDSLDVTFSKTHRLRCF